MMVDYELMGKRMRAKRRIMKMSQEDVANAVRIAPSYYSNIERGVRVPSIDTLVAVANVLEVGTDFLLADSVKAVFNQRTPEETRLLTRCLREKVEELVYDIPEEEPDEPREK